MIKHIVCFRLADEAEGKSKAENAQIIKEGLENLVNLIPQVKKIEVGINHPATPVTNFDVVLYSEFDCIDDLNIYQDHSEHKKVGAYIGKVKTDRICVDYEM